MLLGFVPLEPHKLLIQIALCVLALFGFVGLPTTLGRIGNIDHHAIGTNFPKNGVEIAVTG